MQLKKITAACPSWSLTQQAEQMELPEQEIYEKMRQNYQVMASCIQPGSAPDLKSTSGLTGGDAYRMRTAVEQGKNLTGPFLAALSTVPLQYRN